MAGIENIVIHSKSYIVRWIQVPEYHSISWSVQPQRKSVNFGIFKHPGNKNGLTPSLPTQDTLDASATPAIYGTAEGDKKARRNSISAHNVIDKLQGVGLKSVAWTGKCQADQVSVGRYDVAEGEGGMYGLVFDNTFSKQTSKTVMFVLMTHPTNSPPKSGHHLHYAQAFGTGSANGSRKDYSPTMQPVTDSNESLPTTPGLHSGVLEDPRPRRKSKAGLVVAEEESTFYTGVLHKKRRKKGQGYARRFFSLDFTSSTLSYYHDRHSSALRGAVPLSLAAIGVNEKNKEFSIDSGAEVWHLKAANRKDFDRWRDALERASEAVNLAPSSVAPGTDSRSAQRSRPPQNPAEAKEWARVEQLVSQVAGTRDAVRGLAKDTDPKYMSGINGVGLGRVRSRDSNPGSNIPSPASQESGNQYFPDVSEAGKERKSIWNRKSSAQNMRREKSPMTFFKRNASSQLVVPAPSNGSSDALNVTKRGSFAPPCPLPEDVHSRCIALLNDLDGVVADFSALVAESKGRRLPPLVQSVSRLSLDSIDQEFFDAEDGPKSPSQLLSLKKSGEFDDRNVDAVLEQFSDDESETSSDAGDQGESTLGQPSTTAHKALFPACPQSLQPLPLPAAKRRNTVNPPKQAPPSIMGFLRKNAGKDLSTVSMPVTANEPTSLLQRLAESVEYPQLLDSAASSSTSPAERLMYVAAFAVSYYSNNRVKERALRKPFNPMLGETYELVREDLGFRFVAEKVSHHPVRMACQADSLTNGGWSFSQSPQPVQKFWGKSMELNNEGRVRVALHAHHEHYSWNQATCFLRNVMAGEKYVEPVQTMTVHNESNGMRAVATFKAGGMFSGRSEDVTVELFSPDTGDVPLSLGLTGKWTDSFKRSDTGATIWSAGALVPDAPKTYGLTAFAAALNQTTAIEDGHLPPTDSRLRPDQQALERSEVDSAEGLKARLEERQRARRKVLESHGQKWKPQFFELAASGEEDGGQEVWMLKGEKGGYWDRRVQGDWRGVEEVFEL